MRIMLTGFGASHFSERAGTRHFSVMKTLQDALTGRGHEVERRPFRIEESTDDFDRVIVGVMAPHSLGAVGMYGSLSAISRAWGQDKLTLLVDDADVKKIFNGCATLLAEDAKRFAKSFYANRQFYAIAIERNWRLWLIESLRYLGEQPWPRVLVPTFAWHVGDDVSKDLKNGATEVIGLDLTRAASEYGQETPAVDVPVVPLGDLRGIWVSDPFDESSVKWAKQQQLGRPLREIAKGPDKVRLREYSTASAALVHSLGKGFWHPRYAYAAIAGCPVATDWRLTRPLGEAWAQLPAGVEARDRDDLAKEQREALFDASPTTDDVIERVLG